MAVMIRDHGNNTGTPGIPLEEVRRIAARFDLHEPIGISDFEGKGNINQQTYLVAAGPQSERREYLLQAINPEIFVQPRLVMDNMVSFLRAQRDTLSAGRIQQEEWDTVRLIPTKEGALYLEASEDGIKKCWRMMSRIPCTRAYKSLGEIPDPEARLRAAGEAGRGLAVFGILSAGMDAAGVTGSLPGYRDTRLYYDQLLSVLAGNRTPEDAANQLPSDPLLRLSTERHFLVQIPAEEHRLRLEDPQLGRALALALEQKSYALTLVGKLAAGELKKTIVHGDAKLENFLFSISTGRVKAIVDLDTIMPHTWLSDWGDLVRSLVNIAGERETNLEKIEIDMKIFEAAARGFLASSVGIARDEAALMADAAQIMALELGVRYLADYVRGDSYFKLGAGDPPDLNRTRALVQFRVFEKFRAQAASAKHFIETQIHSRTW
jgi:hypothetical protein